MFSHVFKPIQHKDTLESQLPEAGAMFISFHPDLIACAENPTDINNKVQGILSNWYFAPGLDSFSFVENFISAQFNEGKVPLAFFLSLFPYLECQIVLMSPDFYFQFVYIWKESLLVPLTSKIIWQLVVSTETATTTLKNCARLSRLNNNFREIDIQLLTNVFVCLFIDYVCQLTKEVKSYFLKSKTSGVETVFLREAEQINFFFHDTGAHPSQNWELFGPFFNQIQPGAPGFWSGLLDQDWGQASWVQLPAP